MRFVVRVKPGSSRARVAGSYDGPHGQALVVAVAAHAVGGAATEAALRALAEAFDLRQREVELVVGRTSRDKIIDVPDELRDGTPASQRWQQLIAG